MSSKKFLSLQKIQICLNGKWLPADENMSVAAWLLSQETLQTRMSVTAMPRFAVCGMGVCQECRISINGQAHQLACQTKCLPGMVIETGEIR